MNRPNFTEALQNMRRTERNTEADEVPWGMDWLSDSEVERMLAQENPETSE